MSEALKFWNPTRKNFLNMVSFLVGIIISTVIWPHETADNWLKYVGSFIVVSSLFLVLYMFLSHFRPEVLRVNRKTLFIVVIILSFIIITRYLKDFPGINLLLLIPFAVIPVVIRTFYDARLALFILLITIILSGFMVTEPFQFLVMNFIAGMAAIFTLVKVYRKWRLLLTSFFVIVSYSIAYIGMHLLQDGNTEKIYITDFLLFAGNGILVLFSYPLILMFEQRFLFLSDATLLELGDTNQPVLRKFAEEAAGSFQHSLQVANLAEEAARAVGANLLLVRIGALYHDIGKVANPDYFTENLQAGVSPHEKLNAKDSAKVIINHVKSGVVLAKNYKVPVQIIDFIRTHHGTTVAYYFFKKYTAEKSWDAGIEKDFTYPGPKPFSKETAIVMMADVIEASSRSLDNFSEEAISELVDRIIYIQEQDGQYSDAPLTFKDISDIKTSFKKRLYTINHVRIPYPERNL